MEEGIPACRQAGLDNAESVFEHDKAQAEELDRLRKARRAVSRNR
jgi:hypothetical protein